jgi:hypothetical protein
MSTNINQLNSGNPSSSSPSSDIESLENFTTYKQGLALSASIQALLLQLQQETNKLQQIVDGGDSAETSSSGAEGTSNAQATTSSTTSNTSNNTSLGALEAIFAELIGLSNQFQTETAQFESSRVKEQSDMANTALKQTDDDLDKWLQDLEKERAKEHKRDKWQKFTNFFSTAFDDIAKVVDKCPLLAYADKLECTIENALGVSNIHLFQLESLKTNLGYVEEGFQDAINWTAHQMATGPLGTLIQNTFGISAEDLEKGLQIALPIIIAIAVAVASAGTCSAESTAIVGEEAGGAVVEDASMARKCINVAKKAVKAIFNMTKKQSAAVFAFTTVLQHSGFVQNFAKVCANGDADKEGRIEMGLSTTLSVVSSIAGYQLAISFLPKGSGAFNNLYNAMLAAQAVQTTAQGVTSAGVAYNDFELAPLQEDVMDLNADITWDNDMTSTTMQQMQAMQKTLSTLISSMGETIQGYVTAVPRSSALHAV